MKKQGDKHTARTEGLLPAKDISKLKSLPAASPIETSIIFCRCQDHDHLGTLKDISVVAANETRRIALYPGFPYKRG